MFVPWCVCQRPLPIRSCRPVLLWTHSCCRSCLRSLAQLGLPPLPSYQCVQTCGASWPLGDLFVSWCPIAPCLHDRPRSGCPLVAEPWRDLRAPSSALACPALVHRRSHAALAGLGASPSGFLEDVQTAKEGTSESLRFSSASCGREGCPLATEPYGGNTRSGSCTCSRTPLKGHLCSASVTRCRLLLSRLVSWGVFAGCYLLAAAH